MDIKKHIKRKTGVNLPISGGDGQSKDNPVKINSDYKHMLIEVENDFISLWLDEGKWRKEEQSLLMLENDKKIDKINIHFIDDNGTSYKKVFWFDITDCF
jgi:hypothetical protein